MFKIKFGLHPAHWGTSGRTREIMKAEYELEGYELAVRLLEIKKEDFSDLDFTKKLLEVNKKFNKISDAEYNRGLAESIVDEKQRKLALLELDLREGKITQIVYDKESATIKGEPWVNVVNMDFTKKSALEGSFELDWNEAFVEKLRNEGYQAPSGDLIVNQWFSEVCRNVAMEEFDGTGDFTADSEANLETLKRWQGVESFPAGRKGYK